MVSTKSIAPRRGTPAAAPYARVKRFLMAGLASNKWRPGALMPSEAALVAQFGVSRMTINRALRDLQSAGHGRAQAGRRHLRRPAAPHFVDADDPRPARGNRGPRPPPPRSVHLAREESAPAALARQLGLAAGAPVYHSLIVHHDNGVPLQCEDRYVNPACAPDYLQVDFERTTPTQHLLDVAPLWQAQYTIEASNATAQEARLLGIGAADPCLVVVRRTVSRGVPVTLARLVHPGSRYQLEGSFSP